MYYIVKSKPIKVKLPPYLEDKIHALGSPFFNYDQEAATITFDYSDEGFETEEVSPYLSCAVKKGELKIHFEDHKGESSYVLQYGPGHCEEV